MWTVQRLIQAGVNRFVLDLPPTPAVAVAGVAFLTRAWGTIIALVVAERTWDSDGAVPCCHPVRGALHDRQHRPRPRLGRVQARAEGGSRVMRRLLRRRPLRSPLRSRCPPRRSPPSEPLKTDPTKEFLLEPWIKIPKLGPIDLSITKGVFYLLLSTVDPAASARCSSRATSSCTPSACRPFVEIALRLQRDPDRARSRCRRRRTRRGSRTSPRCSSSSWINNMISYLPLPVDTEHKIWGAIPTPSFYAATSNLSVTLALTLVTFFASHYVGIQQNGAVPYFKSWFPPVSGRDQDPDRAARDPLAVAAPRLAQRPAVREHAGGAPARSDVRLAHHHHRQRRSWRSRASRSPCSSTASSSSSSPNLQAFIFALLSGIYIGTAAEPHH